MRVVSIDLGGVLVELGDFEDLGASIGTTEPDETRRWWLGGPAVRCHERGLCTREEFGRAAVDEFGLDCAPEEFLARFLSWPKGLSPGSVELVQSV